MPSFSQVRFSGSHLMLERERDTERDTEREIDDDGEVETARGSELGQG
jgi:hypothetical protein